MVALPTSLRTAICLWCQCARATSLLGAFLCTCFLLLLFPVKHNLVFAAHGREVFVQDLLGSRTVSIVSQIILLREGWVTTDSLQAPTYDLTSSRILPTLPQIEARQSARVSVHIQFNYHNQKHPHLHRQDDLLWIQPRICETKS